MLFHDVLCVLCIDVYDVVLICVVLCGYVYVCMCVCVYVLYVVHVVYAHGAYVYATK